MFGQPVKNCFARFVIMSNDSFQYVTGSFSAEEGKTVSFMSFDPSMTIEEAKAMLETNGFEIDRFGKVENGQIIDLL